MVLQVALPWHITKSPVPALQPVAFAPGVKDQLPTTTPLLRVPEVVEVPLEVPVRSPVSVKTLPFVLEAIVMFRVPVTALVELVTRVASPETDSASVPLLKHDPALKNANPVTSIGPLFVTENVLTKFSRLA